jgi:choline monooxygenase
MSLAYTMPAAWYHAPEIYAREGETIFAREWLYLGPAAWVASPGDYAAEAIAGRPILAVRDRSGALAGFANVCRHRAGPILPDGQGRCDVLRCRYHGWTYGLDGSLKAMPNFEAPPDFDKRAHGLPPVRVAEWRGLVFVNLDSAAGPLEAGLGDLVAAAADHPLERYEFAERVVYPLDFNWKNYVDNYMEALHIPLLHPGLAKQVTLAEYRVEPGHNVCIHRAPVPAGATYAGLWLWRWPNLTIGTYEGGLNATRIQPLGPRAMSLEIDFYFDPALPETERRERMQWTRQVVEEDFEMCRLVQRNLESGLYGSGPLSPRHENGVAYFHDRVRRALGNRAGAG